MKARFTRLAGLMLVCFATAAQAVPTLFTTRASFNAANPGATVEDFQDFDATTTVGFAAPIDSTSSIPGVLSPGDVAAGVTFALTIGTDAYFAAPGQSSNPTNAIGVNTPIEAGWDIIFGIAVNAAAFDVFQNVGGGTQSGAPILALVEVFGTSGLLFASTVAIPSGGSAFFGVNTGADLITHVVVNSPISFDVIDDVAFVLAQVPEPGPLALVALGLAALGFARRRNA